MEYVKKKKKIIIAFVLIIFIVFVGTFAISRKIENTANLDQETAVSLTYDKVVSGDEKIDKTDYVTFDAFFLKDLDDDGYAESIRGTCNEIGSTSTLYMELNVLTQGRLEDGEITINGENFYLKTAIPADGEIAQNAIGNNISTIKLNTINNGTQKLLSGTVHCGTGLAALNNNINNYSAINSVTLTGTYVAEDGTRTQISKTVPITVDWYGTATAQMPTTLAGSDNTNQQQDISTAINEEDGTFTVNVTVGMQETDYELLLSGAYIYGVIPDLAGYNATNVKITGTNVTYAWDEQSQAFTAQRLATVDDDGNITSQAYDGKYEDNRYNKFNFSITYPLEAYESIDSDSMTYILTAWGYYEGYNNNSNEVFDDPYVSNTACQSFVVNLGEPEGDVIIYSVKVGKISTVDKISRYVISKEKPLSLYNGLVDETEEDYYKVAWVAETGSKGTTDGIIMKETQDDSAQVSDQFITSSGKYVSMEDVISNVGIYFSGASNMLGEDGWIKIYNDETGELIVTFDSSTWNSYTENDPYYYDESVKHIRVETSQTNPMSIFYVYSIKEIDDDYLVSSYMKTEFDRLSYIYTRLEGYIYSGNDTMLISSSAHNAFYEAPFALSELSISTSTFSTQVTKNARISISTVSNTYNEVEWTNGSFLIEMPEDIISVDINSVEVSNNNVTITSYEKYEENGIIYLKINTENEIECTYTIYVDADLTPDPRVATSSEEMKLYYYNESAVSYYSETADVYDVNDNLSTSEKIGIDKISISLISPNSLLTTETVTNYDNNGSLTIAPNVAEIDKEQKSADINISITNNYSSTISDVLILGRVPYEGNSYVINGSDLGSTFTATMQKSAISVPSEISDTVKVYYSTNENATKDLNDSSNSWVEAQNVSDWSQIKSYLIDFDSTILEVGDSYDFSYTINLPENLEYNDVAYSHHAVYFTLDTTEGKYVTYTEPNKVGIMVAEKFDLELTKYQIYTDKLVSGATYKITDTTTNEYRTAKTDENGVLTLKDLYVNRTYTIQEIKAPSEYQINSDIITFTPIDQDGTLVLESYDGNVRNIDVVQAIGDDNYKVTIETEEEVKANLKIQKTGENLENLQYVKFSISGTTIRTNEYGVATMSGIIIGKEYTLEEITAADGYYLTESTVTFKLEDNNGQYVLNIMSDDGAIISSSSIELSDSIPTVILNIVNEKIPTYSLKVKKIEAYDEDQVGLQGARYELYSQDNGTSQYLTTNGSGVITFENLYNYVDGKNITGNYVLREIQAPDGYVLSEDEIEFRVELVNDELQIAITNEDELSSLVSYTSGDGIVEFVVQDYPIFTLTKVDEDTNEVLANAQFIIYQVSGTTVIDYAKDSNGNYLGELNSSGQYVVTTDENGEYSVALKGGFYKAVEVVAPEGYELPENEDDRTTYFTIEGYDVDLEINTVEEFVQFANDTETYASKVVSLNSDLDFTGVEYTPKQEFDGTFLGNGHTISNLSIESEEENIGLFATSNYAVICDLIMENVDLKVTFDGCYGAGAVVGASYETTISNCYVTGNIETEGELDNLAVGGVAGTVVESTIESCYSTANITTSSDYVSYAGGIVGFFADSTISNCYNAGDFNGSAEYVGGIIGTTETYQVLPNSSDYESIYIYNKIENCYNIGKINVNKAIFVGGIVGVGSYSQITNCYNDGNIITLFSEYIGGIAGRSWTFEVANCYNTGDIVSSATEEESWLSIGGIIGNTYGGTIEKCYNLGDLVSESSSSMYIYIGGIIGSWSYVSILDCYNEGNLSVTNASSSDIYVGGISADGYGEIVNCYNSGNITDVNSLGEIYIGGICGRYIEDIYILNSYNTGTLSSEKSNYVTIGGIVGYNYYGDTLNCYNQGDIICTEADTYLIGGIFGYNKGSILENCYNTGNVTGSAVSEDASYAGAIIGYSLSSESTTDSYWLEGTATSGIGFDEGSTNTVTSLSDSEMQSQEFVDILNENIEKIDIERELLSWQKTESYPTFVEDLNFEIEINVLLSSKVSSVIEVVIENTCLKYDITTEIGRNSNNKRVGGTITGVYNENYSESNYAKYVETVNHGYNAQNNIVITPDDGYFVNKVTLDGEEITFTSDENGIVTLPVLENVTSNHHYIVTFETQENKLAIKKVDSATGEPLADVSFAIDQVDERDEITSDDEALIFGELTANGSTVYYRHTDVDITDDVVDLDNLVAAGTYYFVKNEDGTLTPNNTGVANSTANSYLEIDLTGYDGYCVVGINASVSSQSGADIGYATTRTTNTTTPAYNSASNRFMYISGTVDATDYYGYVLTGGNTYYLYLGYRKDGSTNTGDDQVVINSIHVYGVTKETFYFEENEDGSYTSNNQLKSGSTANSYMKLDLTNYTGKYDLIVNASISSESGADRGYVTVTSSTTAPAYNSSSGRFIYISGEVDSQDYIKTLEGGSVYYLHFGYYKNSSGYSGDDTFTINSVKIALNDSELYHTSATTNEEGEIEVYVPYGVYTLTETKGQDLYETLEDPVTLTFKSSEKLVNSDNSIAYYNEANDEYIVKNIAFAQIIVHHVLLDKDGNIAEDDDGNTIYVAEDETYRAKSGTGYTTAPQLDTGYAIATYGDVASQLVVGDIGQDSEYYIPSNSYGTYSSENTIEVTYYYVEGEVPLTVYHYIEGTEEFVPVVSEDIATVENYVGNTGTEYKTYALTDDELDPRYELVETPSNANGTYGQEEITVTYYYKLVKRDLTIVKSDNDGQLLEGVEFSITDSDGNVETYITNSYGKISVTLTYGTYTVKETATLEGYELDDKEYTINVTKDDNSYTLSIDNSKTSAKVIVNHYVYDRTLENPHTTIPVVLSDGTESEETVINGNVGDEYYTYLANVTSRYSYVESIGPTSGNMTEDIIYVNYYYELVSAKVHVTYIDADTLEELADDVTIDGYVDDEYETEDKIDEINNTYDNKYELVSTTDNNQGTMTEQTIEVIYYYSKKETSVIVKHQTEDGTDLVDLEQIDGKIDDEYETEPKDFEKYELKTTPDNATGTMTEEQITVIYVYSLVEGSVTITKVDKTDETKTLSGATYKIEKLDDAGNVDSTFASTEATTNENGIAKFESLTVGKYRITEIQAPEGYELATDSIDIEITKDNRDIEIKATDRLSLVLPETGEMHLYLIVIAIGMVIIAIVTFKLKGKKQVSVNK